MSHQHVHSCNHCTSAKRTESAADRSDGGEDDADEVRYCC